MIATLWLEVPNFHLGFLASLLIWFIKLHDSDKTNVCTGYGFDRFRRLSLVMHRWCRCIGRNINCPDRCGSETRNGCFLLFSYRSHFFRSVNRRRSWAVASKRGCRSGIYLQRHRILNHNAVIFPGAFYRDQIVFTSQVTFSMGRSKGSP